MKNIFLLLLFFFVAQQTSAFRLEEEVEQGKELGQQEDLASEYFSQIMGAALSSNASSKLYEFIYDWIGTPYRLGGNSKRGIDCSGFVSRVYANAFNMMLGESSSKMFTMTKPIDMHQLRVGDLVFFKTRGRRRVSHVGIYIGDNKFAHASSSDGVRISSLNEGYWRRHFFKGGQIHPDSE